MRDSLEDYEYLYVLTGGRPEVDQANDADPHVDKIISGLTSYTRDGEFMYNLRRLIGLKNGGEITTIPNIQPPAAHPRAEGEPGDYYVNFQNPQGEPTADPLIVGENTYMKIGWNEYEADPSLGYGWYGDMAHVMYEYLDSGPNVLQRSILYDDWGRQKVFEFDLPNGPYSVTVSVGWQGRTYSHHKIDIEGISFVDNEATTPASPYIVRTKPVTITDNKLTMAMGIFDEYTMLNYLDIEAIQEPAPASAAKTADRGAVKMGETFNYVLVYDAGDEDGHTLFISDTVPAETTVITAVGSKSPVPTVNGQLINWTVPVAKSEAVTLAVQARAAISDGYVTNRAIFSGTELLDRSGGVLVYTHRVFLPLLLRGYGT
jgi:hypothetical protein